MPNCSVPRKKLYREGDWFLVPLDRRPGQYGLGLVARVGRRGLLAGFFFGPVLDRVPSRTEWRARAEGLRPADALLVQQFGDLGIQDEAWPVLGQSPRWSIEREGWRLPDFGYVDPVSPTRGYLRSYDPDDPSKFIGETECSAEEARAHFPDDLAGHVALQAVLTKALLAQDNHEMLKPFPTD